ncbi:MAG: cardiolipin synthase [Eubacterium sp.]|jgi:cardiolipin synthase|nr:cardiolipin synthase [Eubacterium sp.]
MKRIGGIVFNRMFMVALAILLQFSWLFYMLYDFSIRYTFVDIIMRVLAFILVLTVLNNWTNPYYKLAWTSIILMVPVLGIALYAVFGRSELTKKTQARMDVVHREVSACLHTDKDAIAALQKEDAGVAQQSKYIQDWAQFPLYQNSETNYFPSGEAMFVNMLGAMERAEDFIFLEYFIIDGGEMLDAMLDVLQRKVKEGVLVRLIYDDVGSIKTLPKNFEARLKAIGVEFAAFNPFRPILSIILNNRDHRKILVVDGQIGFTGGINIADEYINKKVRFGYWKDAGIEVKGEAVWSLTTMFLEMWNYIRQTTENYYRFLPKIYHKKKNPEDGFVQPYSDTPLDHENVGENIYLNIINHAKKYVYIYTPYLIIDNELMVALQNAAKCGVDVRIVTPEIPDKKLIFLLTQSYYEQLIQSGVQIYQYTPGFIHAKCFVCDDKVATVGTVNLDYRSLYLHFECGVFMYRSQAVLQVKQDALDTIRKCKKITLAFCQNRNVFITMAQSILRLFSPLL